MKRIWVCGLVMWLGACGPGVDAGEDGNNPQQQQPEKDTQAPTVVSVSPADGSTEVESTRSLTVTFSEGMDTSATGPAVTLEAPSGLELTRQWRDSGRVLEVTSATAFPPGQKVSWRIGTGARDVAGNALKTELTGSFTVAGVADTQAPTVLAMSPVDAASGEPPSRALRVTFSEPMEATSAQAAFFVAKPEGVTGGFTWEGNTLVFTPSAPWAWLQQVEWGVRAGAKDGVGNALAEDVVARFTVMEQDLTRPTVTGPTSGATGMSRRFQLTLSFSEPMDRASTEAALSVTASTSATPQPLSGTVTWTSGDRELTFVPGGDAPYGAFIGWSLTTDAKDLSGNALVAASGKDVFRVIRLETRVLESEFEDGEVTYNSKTGSRSPDTDERVIYVGGLGVSSANSGLLMSRGFLSFDLSPLDPNATRITSAELAVYQTYVTDRSPFTQWGALTWQAVDYGETLIGSAYDVAGGASGILSADASEGWKRVDVASVADARWRNRQTEGTRTQFRFAFDGQADNLPSYAALESRNAQFNKPTLTVSYELP